MRPLGNEEHGHPTRIHEGSCEALGPVAFRLNGVGGVDLDNAPVATPTAINPDAAYQVLISETTIDGTIEDLLAAGHAVMLYESDEVMDAIACGNVGGALNGNNPFHGACRSGSAWTHRFCALSIRGGPDCRLVILGHGLAPVSASGTDAGDHQAEEDDVAHDEEDGHATATPDA